MPFYRTDEDNPIPETRNSLYERLHDANKQIITDELDAGATTDELCGMILSFIDCLVGEQSILRASTRRREERKRRLECNDSPSGQHVPLKTGWGTLAGQSCQYCSKEL
jgi:hypothetical protein